MIRVATVVVTHNRRDDLQSCLAAIAGQSRPPDGVIVVDNASTDGTQELLRSSDVDVVTLALNSGASGGFRCGLEAAAACDADWIWVMDDDCLPTPQALERLLERAEAAAPDVGAVVPTMYVSTDEPLCGWPLPGAEPESDARSGGPFLGILIRAAATRSIGPVRDDFFIWFDDVDYCARLILAGWRIVAAQLAHVDHPRPARRALRVGPYRSFVPDVAPWKEYYGARNELVVEALVRGTPLAVPRRHWLVRDLWLALRVLILWRGSGIPRIVMRLSGRLDYFRGRMGPRVPPGRRLPTL